tara:strand:- start:171 stop:1055 length:885 start_codon:yes stop_codon:yes gene_type:complete
MPFDNLPYAEKIAEHGFVPANHHEPQFFEVGCERVFLNNSDAYDGDDRYWQRVFNRETDNTIEIHSSRYALVPYEESVAAVQEAMRSNNVDTTDMQVSMDMTPNGGRLFYQAILPAYTRLEGDKAISLRVIMFDSYDGSCAFTIRGGLYKFVCANQAIIPYSGGEYSHIRARHTTNIGERIPEIIDTLLGAIVDYEGQMERRAYWDDIQLGPDQTYNLLKTMKVSKSVRDHIYQEYIQDGSWTFAGLDDVLTSWATHYEKPNVRTSIDRQNVVSFLESSEAWRKHEPVIEAIAA